MTKALQTKLHEVVKRIEMQHHVHNEHIINIKVKMTCKPEFKTSKMPNEDTNIHCSKEMFLFIYLYKSCKFLNH